MSGVREVFDSLHARHACTDIEILQGLHNIDGTCRASERDDRVVERVLPHHQARYIWARPRLLQLHLLLTPRHMRLWHLRSIIACTGHRYSIYELIQWYCMYKRTYIRTVCTYAWMVRYIVLPFCRHRISTIDVARAGVAGSQFDSIWSRTKCKRH